MQPCRLCLKTMATTLGIQDGVALVCLVGMIDDRFSHDSYVLAGHRFRQVSLFFLILFTDLGVPVPPC